MTKIRSRDPALELLAKLEAIVMGDALPPPNVLKPILAEVHEIFGLRNENLRKTQLQLADASGQIVRLKIENEQLGALAALGTQLMQAAAEVSNQAEAGPSLETQNHGIIEMVALPQWAIERLGFLLNAFAYAKKALAPEN